MECDFNAKIGKSGLFVIGLGQCDRIVSVGGRLDKGSGRYTPVGIGDMETERPRPVSTKDTWTQQEKMPLLL
ncbi:MAG: hypothetical protein CR994_09140 [Maribacter sp.]|nr:MAG: hypothetical protein CR994_09140 [Maribacter sp.]